MTATTLLHLAGIGRTGALLRFGGGRAALHLQASGGFAALIGGGLSGCGLSFGKTLGMIAASPLSSPGMMTLPRPFRFLLLCALLACLPALAEEAPAWLSPHVGLKDGQIAPVVLDRARALHQRNLRAGRISNTCFFAMDATRPHLLNDGTPGRRFFVICEDSQTFRAVSSGHGSGRNLKGLADFSNGKQCAQNFGNAEGSSLTTGGAYVTAETRTSFKGYYRAKGQMTPLMRSFLQFDGVAETANARSRAIGGHAAVLVRNQCRMKNPESPHADAEGFVPLGDLVDYAAGRSNGCTSWTPGDAAEILSLVRNAPTTLYIYPEAADIAAVETSYWDAGCLKSIGQPRYWSDAKLAPMIARYAQNNPPAPEQPLPICKGQ